MIRAFIVAMIARDVMNDALSVEEAELKTYLLQGRWMKGVDEIRAEGWWHLTGSFRRVS